MWPYASPQERPKEEEEATKMKNKVSTSQGGEQNLLAWSASYDLVFLISVVRYRQQYIVWGQNYNWILCQKSLDIKIMFHEDILYISFPKMNYWLVICIAKNIFKADFLNIQMFLHPQIPDFLILSKPCINGKLMYSVLWLVLWSRVTLVCVFRSGER